MEINGNLSGAKRKTAECTRSEGNGRQMQLLSKKENRTILCGIWRVWAGHCQPGHLHVAWCHSGEDVVAGAGMALQRLRATECSLNLPGDIAVKCNNQLLCAPTMQVHRKQGAHKVCPHKASSEQYCFVSEKQTPVVRIWHLWHI